MAENVEIYAENVEQIHFAGGMAPIGLDKIQLKDEGKIFRSRS